MTAPEMTDHLFSFDEWVRLPVDDRFKVEVVEGVLNVSPRGYTFHQRAIRNLANALDAVLPQHLCTLTEVDVVLARSPLSVRIPDIVVVDTALADTNPPRFEALDVRLAVEVLSEGTVRVDRVMKFAEYAEAGILQYWMVDLSPPISLQAFALADGAYESDGDFAGNARLSVAGKAVALDLARLTERATGR